MDDNRFQKSVQLCAALKEAKLRSGSSLGTALRLGGEISLWDVIAPYLVLYRFPLLWKTRRPGVSWRQLLEVHLRPYLGLAAYLKRSLVSSPPRTTTSCSQWPSAGSTILFLGFSPLFYREVLHPVAKLLLQESQVQLVVLGEHSQPAAGVDLHPGLIFQSIWDHWDGEVGVRVKEMLNSLQGIQKSLLNRRALAHLMQNTDRGFDPSALRREFCWFFWSECRRLISQAVVAGHILARHCPALIVSADDADQRCRVYSLLGQKRGITSLLVQQGLTSRNYPEWAFFSVNRVAAMGETSRTDMMAQGVPADRITVTGHPGFDRLVSQEPEAAAQMRAGLGVTGGQHLVLFASQPHYVGTFSTLEIRQTMIKTIVRAATSLPGIRLIVKPHPAEDVSELRALMGANSQLVLLDRAADISSLINACDILITFFSTVALQALYAGKPVINVAFPGSGGPSLYSESGATWVARSADDITRQLQRLTGESRQDEIAEKDAARQKFVYQFAYVPDGHASKRVAQMIMQLVEQRENR